MYFIFCLSLISFHIWLNVAVILSKYIEQDNYWIFIYHGSWFFRDETLFYPLEIIQGLLKNQKTGWTVVVAFTLCWYLTFLQVDMSFDFNSSYALCQLLSLLCSCLFFFFVSWCCFQWIPHCFLCSPPRLSSAELSSDLCPFLWKQSLWIETVQPSLKGTAAKWLLPEYQLIKRLLLYL